MKIASYCLRWIAGAVASLSLVQAGLAAPAMSSPMLFAWDRGVGLRYPGKPEAEMFLWFYEWNLFEAMRRGQHSGSLVHKDGKYLLETQINRTATEATIAWTALRLTIRSVPGGADLELLITNHTDHEWPEIAAIIPCWNPGKTSDSTHSKPDPANPNFADSGQTRTWFVAASGLVPMDTREIHFNAKFRPLVEKASDQGRFVFSDKWPTSPVDARAGLLLRESKDGRWVTGIAWADFLTVQGHNPWQCMHQGIRVGPLKPQESKTIRGKLYVFQGTKEDCQAQFEKDFFATGR